MNNSNLIINIYKETVIIMFPKSNKKKNQYVTVKPKNSTNTHVHIVQI